MPGGPTSHGSPPDGAIPDGAIPDGVPGGPVPPGPAPRAGGPNPKSIIWLIAIAAVVVVALATHAIHIQEFYVIYFCVLIPSIILHEISHGVVARAFGDDTAQRAGRLTLNPVAHVDPLGSIILPGILLLSQSGMAFGWAKPVPVNLSRLRHPRNDSIWVSLAGPGTNGVLFVACGLAFRYAADHRLFGASSGALGYEILFVAALANLTLGFFNLLPLPPLDGSVLIERLLPARAQQRYLQLRPMGMVVVLLFSLLVFRNSTVQTHLFNGEMHLWTSVSGYR